MSLSRAVKRVTSKLRPRPAYGERLGDGTMRDGPIPANCGDVNFHRAKAHIELSVDFLVCHAPEEKFEYFELFGIGPAYETDLRSAALNLIQISNRICGSVDSR